MTERVTGSGYPYENEYGYARDTGRQPSLRFRHHSASTSAWRRRIRATASHPTPRRECPRSGRRIEAYVGARRRLEAVWPNLPAPDRASGPTVRTKEAAGC